MPLGNLDRDLKSTLAPGRYDSAAASGRGPHSAFATRHNIALVGGAGLAFTSLGDFHGSRTHRPGDAMSKRELIEQIMKLNRSARREFLLCFTENELADYLRQLEAVTLATREAAALRAAC